MSATTSKVSPERAALVQKFNRELGWSFPEDIGLTRLAIMATYARSRRPDIADEIQALVAKLSK